MKNRDAFSPAAVILAGGRSSRLGTGCKALTPLAGVPMIRRVMQRLQAQADPILLSVQRQQPELDEFGLLTVPDIVQRHRGPLTGLCSALRYLAGTGGPDWLLLCPCDAPFLPADLASRLYAAAQRENKPVSVARYAEVLQPTFSLWNLSVLPEINQAVMNTGRGGLNAMLDQLPHVSVDWVDADRHTAQLPPFFNVNTTQDLLRAEQLLDLARSADRR